MVTVDIGVFAHNEAAGIGQMMNRLLSQDILISEDICARIIILANGCSDATFDIAQALSRDNVSVVNLNKGGKSRTWNRFVSDLSRKDANVLVFCDADIEFCDHGAIQRLVRGLLAKPRLWVMNSHPLKDIVVRPHGLSLQDKFIAAAGGGLDDWKSAVCGSLYAMPAERARVFRMPIGLPVEDGFLRAMVLTNALTRPEDFRLIDGHENVSHIYESERQLLGLIRHQTRIVIGSAINAACFSALCELPPSQRHGELMRAMTDESWLGSITKRNLPRLSYGYIPLHFLTKRLARLAKNPADLMRPNRLIIALVGFIFDIIVYFRAQFSMAFGIGVGHW